MRLNMPVSDVERPINDSASIVSTTDLHGNITYANPYFIEISGFSKDELMGAPQNIVRHPDMPVEAFADLWSTIKSGLPWHGIVKNRCKNGDYYWVHANVTPVIEAGQTVGYMSVRTKPSIEQVNQAKKLYADLKKGNPNKVRLFQGDVLRDTRLQRFTSWLGLSVKTQMTCSAILMLVAFGLQLAQQLTNGEFNTNDWWLLGVLFFTTLSLLVTWFNFRRSVTLPCRDALTACKVMAGGDLTARINTKQTDDLGQILRMLHQLRVNLHSIVSDVRNNSEQIRNATSDIVAGNFDLSMRTESQADSLQKTAARMEELASTVTQNSDSTAQAKKMAEDALRIASGGGSVSAEMIANMEEINQSSRRMIEITGMIEGIAFQTNILALNAAVEAARAGEQGRGFAVVASEVRNLAQRSASASKEIKQLIDESMTRIQSGTKLTSHVGGAMQEIIDTSGSVTRVIEDIASASVEQRAGINEINEAVLEMDEMTHSNAHLVEQATSAANNLKDQTVALVDALSVFKL